MWWVESILQGEVLETRNAVQALELTKGSGRCGEGPVGLHNGEKQIEKPHIMCGTHAEESIRCWWMCNMIKCWIWKRVAMIQRPLPGCKVEGRISNPNTTTLRQYHILRCVRYGVHGMRGRGETINQEWQSSIQWRWVNDDYSYV